MSGILKPLVKRRSFVKEYKPPDRLLRSETVGYKFNMNWSSSSGPRMPPGFDGPPQKQPPPDPPGPHHPKPPEEFPVKLSLKLEDEDKDTDLARICSDPLHELPQLVKVGQKFSVDDNSLKLEKGESLLLLFIAELPRIHAVDTSNGSDVWLPVHAEQLYERLPIDPRLDDKLYTGATALMNAKPLPSVVRVLEGYGSDDYTECLDQEDVIRISHVEEKHKRVGTQKVLIAQNQIGHQLELHKDMDCAHFTTMMSALFLRMSELIELEFPQRVRVVEETNFEKRKPKEEKIFKLLSFKKDLQVIATRAKKPGLLSIPITVPMALSTVPFKEKTIQSCLPHLFPPVNLTWGVREIGRPELAEQLREICQPLPEPLRVWMDSYEGKERACQVAKVSKEDLVRDLKELTNYNKDLSNRIAFLGQAERPVLPLRDKPVAPSRPPKPLKLPPKPPKATPTPKPRTKSASETEEKKIPVFQPARQRTSSDGYEVPTDTFEFSTDDLEEDDDYEVVPDVTGSKTAGNKTLQETCQELKTILQRKEKTITKLKEENERLKESCKKLEQEKENIRLSDFKNIDEINRLQGEIDKLLSKDDGDIYDVIRPTERPLPVLPKSADGVIYNTPDSLVVERALLSRTDVEGVADLLRQVPGLSQYVDKFKEESVDGPLLVSLDESVLKEDLGMTGLHARKLLLAVKKHTK